MPTMILLLTVCTFPDAKKTDPLDGIWTVKTLLFNGVDYSKDDTAKFKFVIKAGKVTIAGNDSLRRDYGLIELKRDDKTTPKCIDLNIKEGSSKDASFEGVYKVEGDTLSVCVKVFGQGRPTKFESPDGDNIALLILKREKP